ncbi:hypothetical protein BH11BAC3_BH11BAC3_25490 [soil metagenome]
MKRNFLILGIIFIFFHQESTAQKIADVANTKQHADQDPAKVFLHPPEAAKPGVLWMWMGCNISKTGITKDLEALKAAGFNRTTMFSLADVTTPWSGIIKKSPTPEIIAWTEPWWKMVRFAAEETKRLGMDFGMFNGPGYEASGGAWITPELSMQEICWSDTTVNGGRHVSITVNRAHVKLRGHTPYPIYNDKTGLVEIPEVEARDTFYRDVAVIAVPATGTISKDSVIDITSNMQPDGRLEWNAPAGNWSIYRFGHTTSGTYMQPAQWQTTPLECDKMSEAAVSFHMDHIIGEIQKHLGDLIGTGFTHVHFDSYEAGTPNWTPKMRKEFLNRRGYDLITYLPTFAGRKVGDKKDSAQFANDFDATIKDLFRDIYFKTISEKLKAAHLTFLAEPYGGPWRQDEVMPMVHNVMTEFWTHGGKYGPYELVPTVAALRKSDQNIIEAEAFTGDPSDSKWDETPEWMKPIGDAAFCDGVNRFVLHRFVQQAFDDRYKPGATMGRWGTHLDRTQTWWKPAKAMVTYWQRCQALLQWGRIAKPVENDFESQTEDSIIIKHIHRNMDNANIYFVANTSRRAGAANCSFKVSGMQPELWDPVTADMHLLQDFKDEQGVTSMQLDFDKAQSFFIVFRNPVNKKVVSNNKNFPSLKKVLTLTGAWSVKFDSVWGGPAKPVTFNTLQDWTNNPISGIKYFSGTAVYAKSFDLSMINRNKSNTPSYLDMGIVKCIAHVYLNDNDLGIVWTAPWQVKIPFGLLKDKNNKLVIEVTNVWANRLIGDEQEPEDCEWIPGYISGGYSLKEFPDWFLKKEPRPSKDRYCFTTWKYFTKDSPLITSGLLGPVTIMQ